MVLSATELQKAKKGDGHVPGRRARLCACPWRVTVKHEGEGGREGGMRTSGGGGTRKREQQVSVAGAE